MKQIKLLFILMLIIGIISCEKGKIPDGMDAKDEMRTFVIGLSQYAKDSISDFLIIPQNGLELVTENGDENGSVHVDYVAAIDGHGQEDLFYGYNRDDKASPSDETSYLRKFLDKSMDAGNVILVTDYCSTHSNMDDSYSKNKNAGYVSFAASDRELNIVPDYPREIHNENVDSIASMYQVKNFLYLINPEKYATKQDFINAINATNYDLLIMDLFHDENILYTSDEIGQLKQKANGGSRLVVCYMSIGEAEDYRYYWQSGWKRNNPSFIDRENPDWEGNFKVKYWEKGWQDIIYGQNNSYLKKIMNASFDGVYLDIIDAFEYYE